MTADGAGTIIRRLQLEPHPEGGHFRRTWAAPAAEGERPSASAIYFLLEAGEQSRWHRVDAAEVWLFHVGAPLELLIGTDPPVALGTDLAAGQQPQAVVPANAWQSARTTGAFTLVSCAVSPAFAYEGFELAPEGWSPG
jgi:hypothetical protein